MLNLGSIEEEFYPEWATEFWRLVGHDGTPLAEVGYTCLNIIGNEMYVFLKMLRKPTFSELKSMRKLFRRWAEGSVILISVAGEKEMRFAEFFGLYDTNNSGPNGRTFGGKF